MNQALSSPGQIHNTATARHAQAYRPDIDSLRAIAVLAVMANHLAPGLLPGGYVGVDVFFVISGYLITKILRQEIAQGRFSLAAFYARRARRILPALFAVLAATAAAGYLVMLPSDYTATLRTIAAAVLSVSNLLFWRESAGYFGALEGRHNPLLHTWSLGVEEQFYLLYPLLLLAWSQRSRRAQRGWLALVGLGSLGMAGLLASRYANEVFYLLPFRAWELLAGAVLALGLLPRVGSPRAAHLWRAAGLAAIAFACVAYSDATVFPGFAALAPVLGAAAVIHAGGGQGLAPRLLANRPLVYTGLLSYSLYLWHWPVIVFAEYLGLGGDRWQHTVSLAALSFVLAALSFHFVERPFRKPGAGTGVLRAGLATGAAAALLATAVAGIGAHGFRDRFDAQVLRLDDARSARIPFLQCFERPLETACRLGDASAEPDTLLWGDSHALSWAVAVDVALAGSGRSALLASTSGCPPMLDIDNRINRRCAAANERVRELLSGASGSGLHTVVLAGYWTTYFRPGGPIQVTDAQGGTLDGAQGAGQALKATAGWLDELGVQTVLIGPVPTHARNVPATLAMERVTGRPIMDRSRPAQEEKMRPYREQARSLAGERLRVIEPMPGLCGAADCRIEQAGEPLYMDSHHLSPAGALLALDQVSAALGTAPASARGAAAPRPGITPAGPQDK